MKSINLKRINALLITVVLIFLLAACNNSSTPQDSNTPSTNTPSSTTPEIKPTTITDRDGKVITIPDNVDKIISISPSITETLVHLGLGDKLVAIDKYSVDIEGLPANLPTYDIMSPDIESIAALKPDLIFAAGMSKKDGDDPFKAITDLGVLITYIPSSISIEGIKEDIRFIGQITDTSDKAEVIITDMEEEISDILAKIGTLQQNKAVYFEIYDLYSFGKGTFLNEIIEMLGAKNILVDQDSWIRVSEEVVIDKNPDIIFTSINYADDPINSILERKGWNVITAVKDKNVYQVDPNASSRSNEYVVIAMKEMAKALYPELFN